MTSSEECAHFLDQIVYLLDNELDEADCSEVRLHLDRTATRAWRSTTSSAP